MTQIQHYLDKISQRHQSGKATEHSYRGDLQNLLESLLPDIAITNEPTRISCGAPDYILSRNDLDIGWIEAKDIGKPLNSKEYKEQFDRYRAALDNLIITDYVQFDFYRSGEKVTSINLARLDDKKIHALPENFVHFIDLIKDFANYTGQSINSAALLSKMMAAKARLLANVIENALNSDEENAANSSLKDQLHAFKSVLLHEITPAEFADIYAQTIAYGLFAARLHDDTPNSFTRQQAAEKIPLSNPFLRKLFHYIAGFDLDARIVWIVDALAAIFRAVNAKKVMRNFGNSTGQQDPIIHFYETFLAEYDPKLRKSRGVWYTPEPVVNFIVRAVDDILKIDFNLNGLADTSKTTIEIDTPVLKGKGKNQTTTIEKRKTPVHQVQILDPATGTGTFLAAVVKHIYAAEFETMQGAWSSYVEEHLIPRLNGFEILMASYAMAHLKMDLLLTETGYIPKKQPRFNIYLTNSLEKEHPDTGTLFTFARWLSDEANEANYIKRDTPVMVVMGNPPYSVSSSNKNDWILELISDYKKNLNEKNIQPLSDDYIKFIRYGSHFIEKNGAGILAYISNNSFIDGVIHRQMRKHLLETFDSIYILDLHGSNKKKETAPDGSKDENVFDIMQGVSINIFVKTGSASRHSSMDAGIQSQGREYVANSTVLGTGLRHPCRNDGSTNSDLAQVYHFDLYGSRKHKYDVLSDNSLNSLAWNKIACRAPEYFFIAKDIEVQQVYEQGLSLNELFIVNSSGIKTHRDDFVIDFNADDLTSRIQKFYDLDYSDAEIKTKFELKDNRDWNLSEARQTGIFETTAIKDVLYRPFDYRKIYYDSNLIDFCREKVMKNFHNGKNLGLCFNRQIEQQRSFTDILITSDLFTLHSLSLKESNSIAPLYLYPETTTQQSTEETNHRTPNLNQKLVKQIAENLGLTFTDEKETTANTFAPIDILDYIYAVLHSPNYRATYKEFLKIDFPRVPYPNTTTFWQLVKLGGELRQLHLLERSTNQGLNSSHHSLARSSNLGLYSSYPIDGDNVITRKLNKNDFEITDIEKQYGRVWINNTQYFDNVPLTAWAFYIGGYQPAQKWLKDRHGRVLTIEDIKHYQKIINALIETDRIMKAIDLIELN